MFFFRDTRDAAESAGHAPPDETTKYVTRLVVIAPSRSRFVVLRNGMPFADLPNQISADVETKDPGAYRVEVYRDDLGPPFDKIPWIISNPIYLR